MDVQGRTGDSINLVVKSYKQAHLEHQRSPRLCPKSPIYYILYILFMFNIILFAREPGRELAGPGSLENVYVPHQYFYPPVQTILN